MCKTCSKTFFFARKLNTYSHLGQVEKKFRKTPLNLLFHRPIITTTGMVCTSVNESIYMLVVEVFYIERRPSAGENIDAKHNHG